MSRKTRLSPEADGCRETVAAQPGSTVMAVWWISDRASFGNPSAGGAARRWIGSLVLAGSVAILVESSATAASRLPTQVSRRGLPRLRGGGNLAAGGFNLISPPEDAPWFKAAQAALEDDEEPDPLDEDMMMGDMYRLNHGYGFMEDDHKTLRDQFDGVAEQVQLTQQYLVLMNSRIESLMPGGWNCSYADSWATGQLWDKADDDFRWTRSAWLQALRAESWEEMPPVWKRIVTSAWTEFQEFLADAALPDGGRFTEKYAQHAQGWEAMRAAYMSNLNRALEERRAGALEEEMVAHAAAAKAVVDARNADPEVLTVFEWLGRAVGHVSRIVAGEETEADELARHRSTEVQLFGITLFNARDPLSERLWSVAQSQGETVTSWPFRAAAWVARKLERDGAIRSPPQPPTLNGQHVLLGNTAVHAKHSKEGGGHSNNALDRLHNYMAQNFELGLNGSAWSAIRESNDSDEGQAPPAARFPEMPFRTPAAMEAHLDEALERLVRAPLAASPEEASDDELAAEIASLDLEAPRGRIQQLFREHAGGEMRLVAAGLALDIPPTEREWMDDPLADEGTMLRILQHPRIRRLLVKPDRVDPPILVHE